MNPSPILALVQEGPPGGGAGSGSSFWMLLLGMFVILWFVAIRPERKERRRREEMIASVKKNERVLLNSGMYATVAAVHESDLTIRFDDGPTRVRVVRTAIGKVLRPEADAEKG